MKILVTGGAGYIGSHTCLCLLENGYEVVAIDDLSNSSAEALNRVQKLAGKSLAFVKGDIRDSSALRSVFSKHKISGVIHFAGKKAVGESVEKPLEYYDNNITGTLCLLAAMREAKVKKIVFSSSATVYRADDPMPLTENMPLGATNPYGQTKVMIEQILRDLYVSDSSMAIGLLRYFNPIGAHESGEIGENPRGIPNNLMPYITQVAFGRLQQLSVFGDDYDTPDGSGVRDYIHVCDLAEGHIKALEKLEREKSGIFTYNLGTGKGTSVLEMINIFKEATGAAVPYSVKGRRAGDNAVCYADPSLAEAELGWTARRTVFDMCRDSYNWQKKNPNGFEE